MKLFLDDEREPSWIFGTHRHWPEGYDGGWVVVRTAEEALEYLETGTVEAISFDNDLGYNQMEGREVCEIMCQWVVDGKIPRPKVIHIHTANIVAENMMYSKVSSMDRLLHPNP